MKNIRVLLADDHRIVLAGLQRLLEPEFDVVGAVENGRELVQAALKLAPDVIVADISMPSLSGIEAARQLRKHGSNARILFLTMHGDSLFVREALRVGGAGYVLKADAPDKLVIAILQVMRKKFYMSADALQGLATGTYDPAADRPLVHLTARQREVLQLLAEGRTLKEMANEINIDVRTVEFHVSRLMQRLSVQSSAELTAIAIRHGLVPSGSRAKTMR